MSDLENKKHRAEVWTREIVREIEGEFKNTWLRELPQSHGLFDEMFSYKAAKLYKEIDDVKRAEFESALNDYVKEFQGGDQTAIARDLTIKALDQTGYQNGYSKKLAEGIALGVVE